MLKLFIVSVLLTTNFYIASGASHLGATAADVLGGDAPLWMPLMNSGAFGMCLAWFMLRNEKITKAQAVAINLNSQALMITVLAMKHLEGTGFRELAETINKHVSAQLTQAGHENPSS